MGSLHQSLRTNRHRSLGRSAHDALRGSDKTPIGVHRQFSSIELLSLKGGRCSPPSSLEYAPIGAQSKQEGGCVGSACACGWGTTQAPPAGSAIAQSPFCPTHSGRERVQAFIEAGQPPELRGKHVVINPLILVSEDASSAQSWSDFLFIDRTGVITTTGRYHDELVLEPDGVWRFAVREIVFTGKEPQLLQPPPA